MRAYCICIVAYSLERLVVWWAADVGELCVIVIKDEPIV